MAEVESSGSPLSPQRHQGRSTPNSGNGRPCGTSYGTKPMFRPARFLTTIAIVVTATAIGPLAAAQQPCRCLRRPSAVFERAATDRIALLPQPKRLARRWTSPAGESFRWAANEAERKWKYIVVHHSATGSGSVESIDREHRKRRDRYGNNWLGIGYHFVIGNGTGMGDGKISTTFRWKKQIHGAHSGSAVHNAVGIGVCVIGNFEKHRPSEQQLQAMQELVAELSTRYAIPDSHVIGHRAVRATDCPGRYFPLETIKQAAKGSS